MKKRWLLALFLSVLLCSANDKPVEGYLPGDDYGEAISLEMI